MHMGCHADGLASIGAQVGALGQTVAQLGISLGSQGGRKLLQGSGANKPPCYFACRPARTSVPDFLNFLGLSY